MTDAVDPSNELQQRWMNALNFSAQRSGGLNVSVDIDDVQDMQNALADIANSAYMQFIKLELLRQKAHEMDQSVSPMGTFSQELPNG